MLPVEIIEGRYLMGVQMLHFLYGQSYRIQI
jgi:hypothetical protein